RGDSDCQRRLFALQSHRRVLWHRGRRDRLWRCGRLADLARPAVCTRSADRDHALAAHTLHRLLDPRTFRRLRRDRNGHLRTLYELERAASDLVRHAAAGHLLLGPRDLSDRGTAVPAHRLPDALAVREIEGIPAARYTVCDRAGDG